MKITPSSIVHETPLRMQQKFAGVLQIRTAERTTGPLPTLQESHIAWEASGVWNDPLLSQVCLDLLIVNPQDVLMKHKYVFDVNTENKHLSHTRSEIKIRSWALVNKLEKFSMPSLTIQQMYEPADNRLYDVKTDTYTCLYSKRRIYSA
jgi:hypothetical protein